MTSRRRSRSSEFPPTTKRWSCRSRSRIRPASGLCRRCALRLPRRVPDRAKGCYSTPESTTVCGAVYCEPTWSLEALPIADETNLRRPQSGDRRLSAVIGETVLLTLYRRSVRGTNPAIELARFLDDANFPLPAPLLATFPHRPEEGSKTGAALARRYILAQGSG